MPKKKGSRGKKRRAQAHKAILEKVIPQIRKTAKIAKYPEGISGQDFRLSFKKFDCHKWERWPTGEEMFGKIIPTLKDFETKQWGWFEAHKDRSHFCDLHTSSNKEPVKRLDEHFPQIDTDLLCLRMSGKMRLWGCLEGNIFCIIWIDPEHTVFPTTKS